MAEPAPPRGGKPANVQEDPDDRATGDEPMTGAQASDLKTLHEEAGDPAIRLTKAQASKRIDEIQRRTGHGASNGSLWLYKRIEPSHET